MKYRHTALAGLCLIALAAAGVARAADELAKVAGKWALSVEGGPRMIFQTLTLEQDGVKIKGTLQGPRGTLPFEGSVKGKAIWISGTRSHIMPQPWTSVLASQSKRLLKGFGTSLLREHFRI